MSCTPSTTAPCCARRWRRPGDRLHPGRRRGDHRWPAHRRRGRRNARHGRSGVRLAPGRGRRAVPGAAGRAGRRARLRHGRPGRRARRRASSPGRSTSRPCWSPTGCAPSRRSPRPRPGGCRTARSSASPARPARPRPRTCSPSCSRASGRPWPRRDRSTTSSATPTPCCGPTSDTRYLVLETSARGIGHIRYLTGIAPPHIGVVLNVGSAHLGEFGSQEAIALAKGELVEALPPPTGVAVLNADDPLVLGHGLADAGAGRAGRARPTHADVRAEDVALDDLGRASFTLRRRRRAARRVALRLVGEPPGRQRAGRRGGGARVRHEPGRHGCGAELGDADQSRWRMELTERADGVLVINDAYNANPESMRAALKTLAVGRPARGARRVGAPAPCSGRWPSSARTAPAEHDADRPAGRAAGHLAGRRGGRGGPPDPARRPLWKAPGTASRAGCRTWTRRSHCCAPSCGPATWCWSRRRARRASSGSRSRSRDDRIRPVATTG